MDVGGGIILEFHVNMLLVALVKKFRDLGHMFTLTTVKKHI